MFDDVLSPSVAWDADNTEHESHVRVLAPVYYCVHFVARVLENVLAHKEHTRIFMANDGLQRLLAILAMPTLPLLFAKLQGAHTVSAALRCISGNIDGDQVIRSLLIAAPRLMQPFPIIGPVGPEEDKHSDVVAMDIEKEGDGQESSMNGNLLPTNAADMMTAFQQVINRETAANDILTGGAALGDVLKSLVRAAAVKVAAVATPAGHRGASPAAALQLVADRHATHHADRMELDAMCSEVMGSTTLYK